MNFIKRNRFNVVLSSDPSMSISELSDPTKLSQLLEETSRLRSFVEEIERCVLNNINKYCI